MSFETVCIQDVLASTTRQLHQRCFLKIQFRVTYFLPLSETMAKLTVSMLACMMIVVVIIVSCQAGKKIIMNTPDHWYYF